MSLRVPFGQYVPGDTAVHRVDPRVKLALASVYAVALFAVGSWWALAGAGLATAIVLGVGRVPVRLAVRGLAPVAWLLAFTVALNALTWGRPASIALVGPLGIDPSGGMRGAFFAVRILLLVVGTSALTLTTSPVAITDAMASLMRPLRAVRFPVDDAAMMLSIALRFVPTTAEEADRIIVAQTARGARFDQGGLVKRARAWAPVLVPLFVRLFRRADDLALAMESRCYTGSGRTHLRQLVMRPVDWLVLVTGVTLAVSTAILL